MSAHSAGPHGHDDHAADDEHADHDDDHHAEPPLPEPESPGWLPLLGGALFLGALIFFLVSNADGQEADDVPADAPNGQAAEDAEQPANRPTQPTEP